MKDTVIILDYFIGIIKRYYPAHAVNVESIIARINKKSFVDLITSKYPIENHGTIEIEPEKGNRFFIKKYNDSILIALGWEYGNRKAFDNRIDLHIPVKFPFTIYECNNYYTKEEIDASNRETAKVLKDKDKYMEIINNARKNDSENYYKALEYYLSLK